MNNAQIIEDLQTYLALLDQKHEKVISAHVKFQIALAGTLKIISDKSSMLSRLQSAPDDLKAYLIQSHDVLLETTRESLEHLRKQMELIVENLASLDRKS